MDDQQDGQQHHADHTTMNADRVSSNIRTAATICWIQLPHEERIFPATNGPNARSRNNAGAERPDVVGADVIPATVMIRGVTNAGAQSAAQTLAELAPRLGRIIANALETDPAVALSLRQYRMLERLSERPHRTGELATISGVTQPTASAAIASLETRGLVDRKPDPADRRATLIEISDEGHSVFAAAKDRVLQRLAIVTADMTREDADALAELQPILAKGMDRLRDDLKARTHHDR